MSNVSEVTGRGAAWTEEPGCGDEGRWHPTAPRRASGITVALHAEWTKLRTVSGPAWLLLAVAVLTIAVGAAATGATHCPQGMTCPVDTTRLSLSGVMAGQAVVAILAVLMFSNEYSSGMIRVTLAAMPSRVSVLAAKAILLAGIVLVAAAVAVFGSVVVGHLILPGHGFTAARGFHTVWLSYGPTLRAACGSVLYLGLIALMSLGVAVLVRDSAVSIGVSLALLYLFPIVLAFIGNEQWQRRLERWTPTASRAWRSLRGPASACWRSGLALPWSLAGWRCGCATPDTAGWGRCRLVQAAPAPRSSRAARVAATAATIVAAESTTAPMAQLGGVDVAKRPSVPLLNSGPSRSRRARPQVRSEMVTAAMHTVSAIMAMTWARTRRSGSSARCRIETAHHVQNPATTAPSAITISTSAIFTIG